jgi:hypothetical protein
MSEHQQMDRTFESRPQIGGVCRPCVALALVDIELNLDDDPQDGTFIAQEIDDGVGVIFDGFDLRQIGGVDLRFTVLGQIEMQSFAQERRRELGPIPKELQQCFVKV